MTSSAASASSDPPRRWQLALAFFLLYVVWGSTYLAIRILVRTAPPLLAAGIRFVIAGAVPLAVLWLRGAQWPNARQWRSAAIVGCCLMVGGNGLVSWAELSISSSLAALLVAVTPMWFVVIDALRPSGTRPTRRTVLGMLVGFAGVAYLVGPDHVRRELGAPSALGLGLLLLASLLWAGGSLYGKHAPRPDSSWMASAMQMLCGGAVLLLIAAGTGETAQLTAASFSPTALLCLVYLITAGSWLGFGSYVWLLHRVAPAKVATYALVNPLVAVVLGVTLLDEPLTPNLGWAGVMILAGIVIVQLPGRSA